MRQFTFRALLFALINAVLIGLVALIMPASQPLDTAVIVATLISMAAGLPYEVITAKKKGDYPDIAGGWGAAIAGAIIAAAVIYAIHLIA